MNILACLFALTGVLPLIASAGTSGPAPIPPPPAFQISTASLNLCRGVVNYIPITATNPGSQPMTSLQLGVIASRNIYAIGNGTVNQATVPANGSVVVKLPIFVSLNTSTLVSAGISVNYNYYSLYSDSEIRNISFGVQTCPAVISANVSSIEVTSGKIQNIGINLTNTGGMPLTSISLKASLPGQDAAILTQQPRLVGALQPGKSVTVNENVFIYRNATQSFPINITLSLYNGTNPVQILDSIQLLSAGIINITPSSITLSPQTPRAGSLFSASFILTDVGTSGASAVTATAMPPAGFSPYGSSSVFVGDMQVDTQTPVTLTMLVNGSVKGGSYDVPVRISYLNSLRQNQSTMIDIPIKVSSADFNSLASGNRNAGTQAQSNISPLAILFFLTSVILAFLYYRERKGKRKGK